MSSVFLAGPNNSQTRMPQANYLLNEADIQQLIATHPARWAAARRKRRRASASCC